MTVPLAAVRSRRQDDGTPSMRKAGIACPARSVLTGTAPGEFLRALVAIARPGRWIDEAQPDAAAVVQRVVAGRLVGPGRDEQDDVPAEHRPPEVLPRRGALADAPG